MSLLNRLIKKDNEGDSSNLPATTNQVAPKQYFDQIEQGAKALVDTVVFRVDSDDLTDKPAEDAFGYVLACASKSQEGLNALVDAGTKGVSRESKTLVMYTVGTQKELLEREAEFKASIQETGSVENADLISVVKTIELNSETQSVGVDVLGFAQNKQYGEAADSLRTLLQTSQERGLPQIDYKKGQAYDNEAVDSQLVAQTEAKSDGEKLYAALVIVKSAAGASVTEAYGQAMKDSSCKMLDVYQEEASSDISSAEDLLSGDGEIDTAALMAHLNGVNERLQYGVKVADTQSTFSQGNILEASEKAKELPGVSGAYDASIKQLSEADEQKKLE